MGGLTIKLTIGDRIYRITVQNEREEECFRKAATLIEEKIKVYGTNFAYKDKQDLLAMVALHFAFNNVNAIVQETEDELQILNKLEELNNTVANCI